MKNKNISISQDLYNSLLELSEKESRSISEILNDALSLYNAKALTEPETEKNILPDSEFKLTRKSMTWKKLAAKYCKNQ